MHQGQHSEHRELQWKLPGLIDCLTETETETDTDETKCAALYCIDLIGLQKI